ncbi:MAG: DUF2231 domain-containing protein [Hyphomicrobiaceae bacterium]
MHPLLAHAPIFLLIALAVTDHATVLSGGNLGTRDCMPGLAALIAVLAGVFALIAYVNGRMASDVAIANGVPPELMDLHRRLATIVTVLALVVAVLRGWLWSRRIPLARLWNILIAAFSLGLAVLFVLTGIYGLELVYAHGVNVATAMR